MVVCPECGHSSNSTTYCISCGARFETTDSGPEPAGLSPTYSAFVSALHSEWPDLHLDEGNQPAHEQAAEQQDLTMSAAESPYIGHVIVRLKPGTGADIADMETADLWEEYVVELKGQDVIIGRLPTCEICLDDDPLVSRYHANLSFRDGVYVLADMGSSNGTYLNDEAVTEDTKLQVGDEITVGIHEILVRSGPADPKAFHVTAHREEASLAPPTETTDPNVYTFPPEAAGGVDPSASGSVAAATAIEQLQSVNTPATEPAREGHQYDPGTLQSQLEDIARVLGQQAAEDARVARELRASLETARSTVASLLSRELEPVQTVFSFDLGDLIQAARQAAENPRHVDYVTALAERAGTIAETLRAVQMLQSDSGIQSGLHALYAQLDTALG
jgi:hypothetical protein